MFTTDLHSYGYKTQLPQELRKVDYQTPFTFVNFVLESTEADANFYTENLILSFKNCFHLNSYVDVKNSRI